MRCHPPCRRARSPAARCRCPCNGTGHGQPDPSPPPRRRLPPAVPSPRQLFLPLYHAKASRRSYTKTSSKPPGKKAAMPRTPHPDTFPKVHWEPADDPRGGYIHYDDTIGYIHVYPLDKAAYNLLPSHAGQDWQRIQCRGWRIKVLPDDASPCSPEDLRNPPMGRDWGFFPMGNPHLARRTAEIFLQACYRAQPIVIHQATPRHGPKAACGLSFRAHSDRRHTAAIPSRNPAKPDCRLAPWETPCPDCYPGSIAKP